MLTPRHPALAVDHVAFAGEAVAVVVARTYSEARDAADLVDVDYEELPVVLDIERAIAGRGGPRPRRARHQPHATWVFDSAEAGTGGDVEEAIAAARADGVVVERRFRQQRLVPAFMEPRSTVVDPTGEQTTMWSATQVPHILRIMLALVTGVPESKIRVIAPDVGGGFGGKLQFTPEELVTFLVARRLGKPVKFTETRSESIMTGHHGRDQVQRLTLAARKDGTVTGLKVELLADMGAYLGLVTPGVPILGAFMFNSIYKFGAYRFACTNVFTNKTWTDAYRGAGRPEATFAIERMMDELAVELGRDPLEVREQNWIRHEEFPFTTVAGLEYDTGNYEAATSRAPELFDYEGLRREQAERRARRDPVQLGIGISTFTEMCGLAPSRVLGSLDYAAGGWETASIRMLPTGKVEVITGASAHGQGHETAWSQIVADKLGVAFEDVEVLHGDTQISSRGLDTYGSRSLVVGGIAVVKAAEKVIDKAKVIAAHILEANADDLDFERGRFSVRGTDQGVGMADIAFAVFTAHNLPDGVEATLDSDATFDPENFSYPHGTHLCATEVDTETGAVTIRSLRLRRRHRRGGQPDDRRGPGARRPRPGHRPGALRGGDPRRPGDADDGDVRGLPRARRAGPAALHDRPYDHRLDHQPVGRQGSRRGGHDRLHPRRRQLRARCGAPPRGQGHRHAAVTAAGLESGPERRRRPSPARARPPRRARTGPRTSSPAGSAPRPTSAATRTARHATGHPGSQAAAAQAAAPQAAAPRGARHDPGTVQLPRTDHRRGRPAPAGGAGGRGSGRQGPRRRAEPAAGPPAAPRRAGGRGRPGPDRLRCAASVRTATPSSSAP